MLTEERNRTDTKHSRRLRLCKKERKKKRVRNKILRLRRQDKERKKKLDMLPSQTAYPAGFETSTPG